MLALYIFTIQGLAARTAPYEAALPKSCSNAIFVWNFIVVKILLAPDNPNALLVGGRSQAYTKPSQPGLNFDSAMILAAASGVVR